MEVVCSRCCGLDVHKATVAACVWIKDPRGKTRKEVRTFGTMTDDLLLLSDWLSAHEVTHVAMESTGVYWKPVYAMLEGAFTVLVVNAHHIKAVPGRKTDVKDCEWIADLLAHGLLRGGFVPPSPIRDLRDLTRHRKCLIDERVREINRLHKLLETANIKLTSVASDVLGVSSRLMLQSLLDGTTDPDILAELAKGQLRKKLPELRAALTGLFAPHHRFMLENILTHIDMLNELIDRISEEVAVRLAPFADRMVWLRSIDGVDTRTIEVVISEIGVDMDRFPTDKHLASWAALCPGNHESAGKRKSGKTRKGNIWLRRALIQAAQSVARKRTGYLAALYQRLVRRRGKKKAVVAVAHAILVIIYHLLKNQCLYRDLGHDYFDKLNQTRIQHHHVRRLQHLGFKVILERVEDAA